MQALPCEGSCNGVGVCNHHIGLCDCPAGGACCTWATEVAEQHMQVLLLLSVLTGTLQGTSQPVLGQAAL